LLECHRIGIIQEIGVVDAVGVLIQRDKEVRRVGDGARFEKLAIGGEEIVPAAGPRQFETKK
jgi:hypothetical protein